MYSFEEIMRFHPDNINVYKEIKRNLTALVPFVGAGLSQFAYYSWLDLLTELTKNITDKDDARKIRGLIKQGGKGYLEAAQYLEDLRTPSNLARDIASLFSPEKLTQKKDQLTQEAIWLLPLLFSGLAITTNFDQTLETVYENNYHLCKIFEHNQLGLLNQYLNQVSNFPGIFKLHGTVSGDYIEYDHIVFTEKQYQKFYGNVSTLPDALKKCLEQKTILFLGCSLSHDNTMDILENVLEEGKNYYTIINCKKSKRDQKIQELGDKNIRAIVYEENHHEAVRVILERLLEETNPDAYKALDYHVGALTSIGFDNRFRYDADVIPFVGREIEMSELNAFLENPEIAFKWWAITGPGGCGKSRLAYEFKKQLPSDWKSRYLRSEDYDNLSSLADNLTDKTLLIADYVQEHAKEIGKFMAKLNNNFRNLPVRVLLIERETNNESGVASWITQLYSCVNNEAQLKKACYKDFLNLHPLSDDNLKKIIRNYAMAMKTAYNKSITMSDENVDMLLQRLKSIDSNLYRPLYSMFLTDAYIEGNDPERWNREDILDYIIERENKRLGFNIEYIIGLEDSKLFSVCKYILCVATVLQDISLDNLKELCPEKWDIVENKAERFESTEELLVKIGLMIKNKIPALRPDLVGEYYVFGWLINQSNNTVCEFHNTVQKFPHFTLIFFERMVKDCCQFINEKQDYWEKILPSNIELSADDIVPYSCLLSYVLSYCKIFDQCEKYICFLEQWYHIDIEIAICFANGLFRLIVTQEEHMALKYINRLEELSLEYPTVIIITLWLARGLFNISCNQEECSAIKTIDKLEKLSNDFSVYANIAIWYAQSLVNLIVIQEMKSAIQTVDRLEKLFLKKPKSIDIAILFANGMFNLSTKQSEQMALETISKFEKKLHKYFDIESVVSFFSGCLCNLSIKQDEQTSLETIDRLEELYNLYPNCTMIAKYLSKSFFELSNKQEIQSAIETINRLEILYFSKCTVAEIAFEFAKSLVNLINRQDDKTAVKSIIKLEQVYLEHSKNKDIVDAFARGLAIFINMQNEQNVFKIEELKSKYPEAAKIAEALLKGHHG